MISGAMPQSKQWMHAAAAFVIFAIFAAAAVANGMLPSHRPPVSPALRVVSALFILLSIFIVTMIGWYRRRIIREFQYDGATLHYKTLAISEPLHRHPAQLTVIREWAGRGGLMGYQLFFRDHPKAYLEDSTPNARALIERLLADMPQPVQNTPAS